MRGTERDKEYNREFMRRARRSELAEWGGQMTLEVVILVLVVATFVFFLINPPRY